MATRVADLAVAPDRAMLDTNVLLAATDERRAEHRDALTVFNDWAAGPTDLCTSGQVLREYLAVATRPTTHNGLGMTMPDALRNVRAFRGRTTLLAEDATVSDRLLGLLAEAGARVEAVTLPVPVGVQAIGPFLSDLRLLRIAEILDEAARPGLVPPPVG